MPNANQAVRFIGCTTASYAALGTYNENTLYFCTDTQQIFLGAKEYTKSIKVLDAQPTAGTIGENGRVYVYNGNLYMCQVSGFSYIWTRIANVNDADGTVTSVVAGSGLTGGTITESGTIAHAVPVGAGTKTDSLGDATPGFGERFKIAGVATDEFGHVTAVTLHDVTLPTESALAVSSSAETPETLPSEGTFEVVTSVEKGTGSHEINLKTKQFKLPVAEPDTTYTIESGETSGSIKVTPSTGGSYEVVVKDWDKIAKISDVTSIFHYKGSVATKDKLPASGAVGDVWYVQDASTEYVYLGEDQGWEEFGPAVDLSAYALSADVIPRVTGKTGEVAQFSEDGTIEGSGYTIEKSVPKDAVFTDTVYTHNKYTPHGKGLYKVQVDEEGHVSDATLVQKSDITDLGIPSENTDTKVKTTPNSTNAIYLAGTASKDETTGELLVNTSVYANADGSLVASAFKGKADSATTADSADVATKATQDGDGNNIVDTYATKNEVVDSKTVWEVI